MGRDRGQRQQISVTPGSGDGRRLEQPGRAWLLLTLALALHVADEAATGFLAVYNPAVIRLREELPWLLLPTFSFRGWITGLAAGILLLALLTPAATRRAFWLRPVAGILALLMVLNALGHLGGSLALGYVMPGAYSSPLLLLAALNLLAAVRRWRPGS